MLLGRWEPTFLPKRPRQVAEIEADEAGEGKVIRIGQVQIQGRPKRWVRETIRVNGQLDVQLEISGDDPRYEGTKWVSLEEAARDMSLVRLEDRFVHDNGDGPTVACATMGPEIEMDCFRCRLSEMDGDIRIRNSTGICYLDYAGGLWRWEEPPPRWIQLGLNMPPLDIQGIAFEGTPRVHKWQDVTGRGWMLEILCPFHITRLDIGLLDSHSSRFSDGPTVACDDCPRLMHPRHAYNGKVSGTQLCPVCLRKWIKAGRAKRSGDF